MDVAGADADVDARREETAPRRPTGQAEFGAQYLWGYIYIYL